VSVSNVDHHSNRLTIAELDAIDPSSLEPSVTIPISAIASVLKIASTKELLLRKYMSSSGVEGLWTEFPQNGSWYMISVSHIDVPTRASAEDLERIADEFLKQQANMKKRRNLR
jgi:hypothetical protein